MLQELGGGLAAVPWAGAAPHGLGASPTPGAAQPAGVVGEAIGRWKLRAGKSLLETGQAFRHELDEHLGRLPRVGAGSPVPRIVAGASPGCPGPVQQHRVRVQGGEDGKCTSASALGIPVKCQSLQLPRSAQTVLFFVTCSSSSLLSTFWFNDSHLA